MHNLGRIFNLLSHSYGSMGPALKGWDWDT